MARWAAYGPRNAVTGPIPVNDVLLRVFRALEEQGISYCLMRDYDQLDQVGNGRDVDLLVEESRFAETYRILDGLGFLRLPYRGHAPHHFFVAYDEDSDLWLELDVVTEVACGRPVYALRTGLASHCLGGRRRRGPTYVASPADELVMLLLHCVVDKREVTAVRRERLVALVGEVTDEQEISERLASCSTLSWPQLTACIRAGEWDRLLAERPAIERRLAARDQFGTLGRKIRDRVLRHLDRAAGLLRPRALSVALLAPDGAGKTTLAQGLRRTYYGPVRSMYMGPYRAGGGGPPGRRRSPFGVPWRFARQWCRFLAARYHRTRGRTVIFDRYGYDALAPPSPPRTRLEKTHAWLLSRACPAPDLVLVLDAPGEVLHARKSESSTSVLERQRQCYLDLRDRLPRVIVVDATPDAEQVRRHVVSLIWRQYVAACRKRRR